MIFLTNYLLLSPGICFSISFSTQGKYVYTNEHNNGFSELKTEAASDNFGFTLSLGREFKIAAMLLFEIDYQE